MLRVPVKLLILGLAAAWHDRPKPHIVFFLADDLGWNDVGFHGSNQIPTPNIDALAYTGVILNNYYVTPLCTPTRSAIMTGKYPIHTGLQHSVILGSTPYGLSPEEKILPQYLKQLGYKTRAVGKWHLGHFRKEYTPELRGFDSHYGYWLGRQDYYDHTALEKDNYWGYDLKRGLNTTWSDYGSYSTDLFTDEAVKIIKKHNVSEPLFLYVAYQAVHSGNTYNPLEAPPESIAKFNYIKDEQRRKFAGMLSKMDDSIGEIISILSKRGMINNSIVIFSSDNGGPAAGFDDNAASNWPLRGVKSTLWEGGIKAAGFIWSSLLPSGIVSNAKMHVADWLPTLLNAVNGKNTKVTDSDGFNLWETLRDDKPSPRTEILINIDAKLNISGLIYKNWKLIKGRARNGEWDDWYGPSGRGERYNWEALLKCKAVKIIRRIKPLPSKQTIHGLRQATQVRCNVSDNDVIHSEITDHSANVFLFDLAEDPCETNNLAASKAARLDFMEKLLQQYAANMVEPRNEPSDPRSNPKFWGYRWINWMDFL